jgi:Tol biopolymer transport system component
MRHGSENLWRVPASGGAPEPVTFGAGQDGDPAVSPDGKRLIYTNTRTAYALMLRDAVTGSEIELLERRAPLDWPRFSHQGDRIAFFLMMETGDLHLFTIRLNAGELRQITHTAGQRNFFPHWSADDRFLFFTRHRPDVSFRKVAATGGDSAELGSWDTPNWAQAHPSGRAVIYQRLSGTQEVATVIRDLESGADTALDLLLRKVRWSRDGRTVFGNDLASGNVVSCPAGPGACRVITRGWTARPSGDGSRIFFLRLTTPRSRYRELWSIGHDGRDEKKVGTLGAFGIDVDFDVSRDDRIVYVQTRQGKAELWRADLR